MNFAGFFFIVYLCYNVILFIVDTLLYTSLWQNNTLIDRLRQHRTGKASDHYPATISSSEPLTAIDRAFDASLARLVDSRSLRSFDGAGLSCGAPRQRLIASLITTAQTDGNASLRPQDNTLLLQSMVEAFPLFVACTMKRL